MGISGIQILDESPTTITVMGPDGQRRQIDKASLDPNVLRGLSNSPVSSVPHVFTPDPNQSEPSLLSRAGQAAQRFVGSGSGGGFGTGMYTQLPSAPAQAPGPAIMPARTQAPVLSPPGAMVQQPRIAQTAPARMTSSAVPGPETVQQSTGVRDLGIGPDEKRVQGAMDEVAEAKQRGLEDLAYINDKAALVQEDRRQMIADFQKQQADLEKERQAQVKADTDKLAALQEDYRKTEVKDPWADRSTGSKILMAIAAGLGAWASSMSRSPNYALQIINDTIDSDLRKQQMILEKKRTEIGDVKLLLGQTSKEFSDRSAALQAAHVLALSDVSAQLDQYATESKSAQFRANAMETKQLVELDKAQRVEAIHAAQAKAMASSSAREVSARMEQYRMLSPEIDARALKEKDRDLLVNAGGKTYLARGIKEANDLHKALPVLSELKSNIQTLSSHVDNTNAFQRGFEKAKDKLGAGSDEYGYMEATGDMVKMKLKTLFELGVLSDREYLRMDKMVPEATNVLAGSSKGRYEAILQDTENAMRDKLSGLQVVTGFGGNARQSQREEIEKQLGEL